MKAYYNGKVVSLKLNGKGINFFINTTDKQNELITADNKKFKTADGKTFLVKEG